MFLQFPDETEIYLEQIAENLTREGFSPIEEAEAFNKLLNDPKFSSSIKFLSSKLGKPEAYIKNKCDLLKFNHAVKKLIVAGTDIKKDKLTEQQLLPIKDLPLEHLNSLALIIARDELPVSDVKKIAKLFKDKDISAGTKDKLLYKSGHELLETWSVYEQNKAERSKPAKAKNEAKSGKPVKEDAEPSATAMPVTAAAAGTVTVAGTAAAEPTAQAADETASAATAAAGIPEAVGAAVAAAAMPEAATAFSGAFAAANIEGKLQLLLASLPGHMPLQPGIKQLNISDKASFITGVDKLIGELEKHLAEWRTVRGQIKP